MKTAKPPHAPPTRRQCRLGCVRRRAHPRDSKLTRILQPSLGGLMEAKHMRIYDLGFLGVGFFGLSALPRSRPCAGGHIPYRDSKLTRILQPSLGGNACTAIICAVTPAACHADESHSTLRFACRAKRVVNNATVNEVLSDAAVLKRQAKEIEELRRVLAASGAAGCAPPPCA